MRLRGNNADFRLADVAQQVVGGFLLAGPFVVTEEVWTLAADMGAANAALTALVVAGIGYGALYEADTNRDAEDEQEVAGVPVRFVTLMIVADTFVSENGAVAFARVTFKAVTVGAVFSVVGAATADSVL